MIENINMFEEYLKSNKNNILINLALFATPIVITGTYVGVSILYDKVAAREKKKTKLNGLEGIKT